MKWCKICVLPDTRPNLTINKNGICNACEFSLEYKKRKTFKPHGRKHFNLFVNNIIKKKNKKKNNYDCLIPVSGGKDSTWQVVKSLENGLTPLAITWKCPSRTKIGQKNLDNLTKLGVDHFDITINPKVEKKFILKTFLKLGSPAIPMHMAIFNLSKRLAINFKIPLIIWGENSAKEYGYKSKNHLFKKNLDSEWIKNYGVTNSTIIEDWFDSSITQKNTILYSDKFDSKFKPISIFLGDFFRWDPYTTYKVSKRNGFQEAKNSKTGLYDFADIDDNFISIHHFIKWYKFGFSRLFDNLSLDIRSGKITRKNALKIIKRKGFDVPHEDIRYFCRYLGISKNYFFKTCEKFRNKKIWQYDKKRKKWFIKEFLIKNFF